MPARHLIGVSLMAWASYMSLPAVAEAGPLPRWSAPVTLAEAGSRVGGADVDGSGGLTAAWTRDEGVFLADRPAGETTFGPPVQVGPAGGAWPQVLANEPGDTLVLWTHYGTARCEPPGAPCPPANTLAARVRSPAGRFGPEVVLARDAGTLSSAALADDGEALVAWQSGEGGGRIRVARRGPGRQGFERPVALSGAEGKAVSPAVAIGERGDAVVAWALDEQRGTSLAAAYRPPGGQFGPARVIYRHSNGEDAWNPAVSITPGGETVIAWDTDGTPRRLMTSIKPPGQGFGDSVQVGEGGGARFSMDAHGDQLLSWGVQSQREPGTVLPRFQTFFSRRSPGAPFGPPQAVAVDTFAEVRTELDGRGNAVTVWESGPERQRLTALTSTRFGVSDGPYELTSDVTQLTSFAVNHAGAAVAMFAIYPGGDFSRSYVGIAERPADETAPKVLLTRVRLERGVVSGKVACSELCRVKAGARLGRLPRRGRPDIGLRGKARLLARRSQARVRFRLSRSEKRRLGSAVKSHGTARVTIAARGEDVSGNRRLARRVLTVRRGR